MEDLLMINLVNHYKLSVPSIVNWLIETEESYFEIEDTNKGDLILHTTNGLGMGKFMNRDKIKIVILNYDKFITSIQDELFKNGRKRCDIILDSISHFILGEIKDRNVSTINAEKNVRKKAKKQLLSTLQTILEVSEIDSYIASKTIKRCCYFNKQSNSPININATTAFNRLPNFYPDGFKINKPDIEALGFDFYEYAGEQTFTFKN